MESAILVELAKRPDQIGFGFLCLVLAFVVLRFVNMMIEKNKQEAAKQEQQTEIEKKELDINQQQLTLISTSMSVSKEVTDLGQILKTAITGVTSLADGVKEFVKTSTDQQALMVGAIRQVRDDMTLQLSDTQSAILNLPNLLTNHLVPARRFGDMLFKRGVLVCDREMKVLMANQDALDLLGQTKEELIGRLATDIGPLVYDTVTLAEVPAARQPTSLAISERRPFNHYLYAYYHARLERWMWFIIDVYPRFGLDAEEPNGIVIEFYDIGELIAIGQQEKKAEANVG